MKKDKTQHKRVYIGNIYYNATEQDILEILSIIGPIVEFQPKYDKLTGKQKGYGFCEYPDNELARSSIRNLNGIEFQNRNLKVHFPDKSTKDEQILEDLKNQKKNTDNYFNEKELHTLFKDKSLQESLLCLRKPLKMQLLFQINQLLNDPKQSEFLQNFKQNTRLQEIILKIQKELGVVRTSKKVKIEDRKTELNKCNKEQLVEMIVKLEKDKKQEQNEQQNKQQRQQEQQNKQQKYQEQQNKQQQKYQEQQIKQQHEQQMKQYHNQQYQNHFQQPQMQQLHQQQFPIQNNMIRTPFFQNQNPSQQIHQSQYPTYPQISQLGQFNPQIQQYPIFNPDELDELLNSSNV